MMKNSANTVSSMIEQFAETLSTEEFELLGRYLDAFNDSLKITALSEIPPEKYLKDLNERVLFLKHAAGLIPPEKLLKSSITIVLKATRLCNLRCVYCHSWRSGPNQVMKFDVVLQTMYKTIISADSSARIDFVWHGGETTLLTKEFFEKTLWIQQQFKKPGQRITNAIQTNGTLLNDDWVKFFKDYHFSVGVSLDGPPEINDKRRVDKKGRPTSHLIRNSIQKLRDAELPVGVLMVLDREVANYGAKNLLDYFVNLDVSSVALLNAIPENTEPGAPVKGSYYSWSEYIHFMADLFEIWYDGYQDKVAIREFDSLLNKLTERAKTAICIFAGQCMGYYLTVEPNGDVSACDKYIEDKEHQFGNIKNFDTLSDLLKASDKLKKARSEHRQLLSNTNNCKWYFACKGGCPHDYRLNLQHTEGFSENCCGFAPLLERINTTISK